jgi:glycosyltransferase involved in cell wall biosynthesis
VKLLVVNWQDRRNPQAGGAEIHVHEVFGRIAARGHSVTLLTSGWPGAPAREEVDGMDVRRTGSRHTFGFAAPAYYRRHLSVEPYDLVVEALNKVPVFAPVWARERVVLLTHHLFGTTAFQEAPLPLAAATWLLERPIARCYRDVPTQAISESTADDLVRRGLPRRNVRVIHPGVDLEFYAPAASPSRSREPLFLYLGRLKKYKRVDLILRAASSLIAQGTALRVVIAGTGDQEDRLRALARRLGISKRVDFVGYVTELRKRELFRSAWANVFPSPKEGWGITNLEAAACGTPTIASDSPGLRESVLGGETGLLVRHGDAPALADAMRALASDPERTERLGANALRFAAGFSWDRAADETVRHLELVART